jgi:hypothetical protein
VRTIIRLLTSRANTCFRCMCTERECECPQTELLSEVVTQFANDGLAFSQTALSARLGLCPESGIATHEGLTVLKMIPLPPIGHDPKLVPCASDPHNLAPELFIIILCPHILLNALLHEASSSTFYVHSLSTTFESCSSIVNLLGFTL